MNPFYNILAKLNAVTSTTPVETAKPTETVYESVEARGSITEAVRALEAKYKTFKESKADDIADKKAEKEAGDWWGDKKADSKKSREVKGDKYGGSKQKSDDEDDFKSKKTAILDKDDDEVLDEGFASPAQEAKIRARLEKLHDSGKYEPEVVYEKVAYEFGMTQKQLQDALAGKSLNEYSQAEYDGAMSDFKKKGGQVKQLPAGNAKNPISTASRHIAGKGEAGKGKTAGRGANVTASKPVVDVAEAFEFDSKNFKNASNLKKAPKAKLVKESASVRNHPIYTNPDAWNHYKKELDEEELNKATQELDEISKLAGLPKPAANTVPPIAPAPVADNNWNDEDDAWLDRQRDAADLQNDYNKENPIDEAEIATGNAVSIRGRSVNVDSIEIDGVDTSDYPDFSDAYITYAEFTDGTPLSEFELDYLANEHGDLVNQAAHDSLQGMADNMYVDEADSDDDFPPAPPAKNYVLEKEMEEGNEFSGALAAAKASGIKDFEVAGKKYTVKEDINVNVTASGEEDALNLFRKLAGMPQIAIAQNEEPCNGAMEVEVDEERDPEYVNSPREQTAGIGAAIPSGNDLHGAKRAYKITQPGDNPMAVTESKKDTSWNKYTGMLKGLLK